MKNTLLVSHYDPKKWSIQIDSKIKTILIDLNLSGYITCSSCQGKTSYSDFKNKRHCNHAFISFSMEINANEELFEAKDFNKLARKLLLDVDNNNLSLSPIYKDELQSTYIAANIKFPLSVRKLFKSKIQKLI